MMRSLSSAVAGLRTHQTKMDVIGNNIANVNTYGFKASRTTFSDVYYQNLSGGNSAGTTAGGTNPTQIGYGSSVATIDAIITQSGSASTDRALDVYITGDGFLVSKDPSGNFNYTRLGNLGFDAEGNLVDGNGHFVQGFPLNPDGTPKIDATGTVSGDALQNIRVSPELLDRLTGIQISNTGAIIGILPGDPHLKVNSTIPDWMNGNTLSIPTTSVYSGKVNVAISGFCAPGAMATALGVNASDILSMEMGKIALPEGNDYKISIDNKGNVTMSRPQKDGPPKEEAVSLTGKIDPNTGKLVLKNKAGDVGLTITLDKSVTLNSTLTGTSISYGAPITTTDSTAAGVVPYYKSTSTTGTPVIEEDASGNPLYVTTTATDTGVHYFDIDGNDTGLFIECASTTTAVDAPRTLALTLYAQMTTTDKGGNVVKEPAEPELYNNRTTLQFGEITLNITDPTQVTAFNGEIGTAETLEGERLNIGNLVLAKFRNAAGLQQVGSSYFAETFNSGEAIFVRPGLEGTGGLKSGYLEMSNVDVSKEFTDMITTQRGFQANTRIVTVSDEMLQELVNLKR